MTARFRKTKTVAGVRLNLGKNGVGASVGVNGARLSVGSDGKVRRTVGLPGTGLSDTEVIGRVGGRSRDVAAQPASLVFDLDNPADRERLAGLTAREITAALDALPPSDRKALRNAWADARYEFRMGALNRWAYRLLHPARARRVNGAGR